MKIFNFGRNLAMAQEKERKEENLLAEAESFDLAGTGGFLSVVKYCVYSILAALNWHLFTTVIPGIWGWAIGSTAILSECFAIYCWNKQNKSAGNHKKTLQFFAVAFTVISFIHGCTSLYEISGAGKRIGRPLEIYSNFVAFPLIFSLMIIAVCVLYYTHWSTQISEERAKALFQIEKNRARLLTQKIDLKNQAEVERARLMFFEDQILIEEEYVKKIEKLAQVMRHGEEVLDSITSPEVRDQINLLMGRLSLQGNEQLRKKLGFAPAQGKNDPKD